MSSGVELLGWVGGGLCAAAYVLVSTRRIGADAASFQALNMVGAALLCFASFHSGALPNAVMNIAWILFGVHSLALASQRRRHEDSVSLLAAPVVVHGPEPTDRDLTDRDLTDRGLADLVLDAA